VIFIVAAALALGSTGRGSPQTEQHTTRHLSAIDVFALADRARAEGRIGDAITFYDALSHDQNADVRAEARFRKGMMLASLKRYREAAVAFRRLLDEKPNAARVRLELARVLALMGDESAARRELRQAEAAGLPPEVALAVGQFDQALRSHKRFGGSVEVALAPDSNINRATEARVLDTIIAPLTLSSDARKQSGIGVHVSGQGYAKFGLGSGLSLVPRVSALAMLYRKSEFTDISSSALIGLEWQGKQDRLTPSIGETRRWYGGKPYDRTDAFSLDWLHALGKRAQLVVSGSASRADYQLNDLQDGSIYALSASLERALSSRAGISVTASGIRQTARDPGYATTSGGLTVVGWREAGRTTLFTSGTVQRTEGDAALFLFGDRRREWFFSARAGATFRQLTIHGLAPYVRVSFERNRSSLQLYDYGRVATEFGLTRAF
jgi:hypothetical protein